MGIRLGTRTLRSRLLVGVAAAAMAVPLAGKANAQAAPAKWSPWVEAGGMVGTRSFGDVDIFLPLWQDQGSLLFGDLRGTFTAQPTEEGNFGIGYRTLISPEWILGGYGYFDIANSANDNLFYQVTLGLELKSVDWDFRVNGYIPINPDGGNIKNDSNPSIKISGNTIQMQTESQGEKALYGFDGEVGWRVPLFPADGDFDVRVYAGGYYFTNSDVDTIAGPRGRIEARLYDIDFLGLQSRLTAQGVVQWDSPRGIQGFGGLELRIPLGAITGAPGPKLNPLDRRMVDRVQRDVDIITEKTDKEKKSEDVIVDELTVSTHTIVFANGGGTGTGAKGDPTDLNNVNTALNTLGLNGGTGSNAIILVDGGAGNVNVTNPFQMLQGQALIGGGSVVPLTGAKTGKTVDFAFDGTKPTLVGTGHAVNLVELAFDPLKSHDTRYQNEIFGVIMDGAQGAGFSNGVHGVNMYRAIVKNSTITSAFANGIFLENVSDGAVPPSSFVHIEGNVISDNGENGILIATDINQTDRESHTQSIIINDNTIESNGLFNPIIVTVIPEFTVQLVTAALISGSNPGNGIYIVNRASGTGSLLSQNLAILDNVISHNAEQGIRVHNEAREDGDISQFMVVDPNTIDNNGANGIFVSNFVSGIGSTIDQTVGIGFNFISHNGNNGILIDSFAEFGGSLRQFTVVYGNSIYHNGVSGRGNGVFLGNDAFSNAAITQTALFAFNTIDHNISHGIYASNGVSSSSLITQAIGVLGDTITHNGGNGIFVDNEGSGVGSSLAQSIGVSNAVITHNDKSGFYVHNEFSFGASLLQDILIDPSTIADNGRSGIYIHNNLSNNGTFSQHIVVPGNTIVNNVSHGIYIRTLAYSASITQGVTIAGNTISGNDADGVRISASARSSHLSDTISIGGNQISNNDSRGVFIKTSGTAGSAINETIYIAGNTIDENDGDGIKVAAYLRSPATLDGSFLSRNVTILNNSLHSNDGDGIRVDAFLSRAGGLSQSVNISFNTIDGTSDNGVQIGLHIYTAGLPSTASVTVSGNSISNTGDDGIYISARVRSATLVEPSVLISNNTLTDLGDDGIDLENLAFSSGVLSQNITIDNNFINFASGNGIESFTYASGLGASIHQALTIDPNTIIHSSSNGIYLRTYASETGHITQTVAIADNSISENRRNGIYVNTKANGSSAVISQSVVIAGNTLTGNSTNGVYIRTYVSDEAFISQTVTLNSNIITSNGRNGVYIHASAGSDGDFATLQQAIVMSGNAINGNSSSGVRIYNQAYKLDANLTQTVLLQNNAIVGNSRTGVYIRNLARADGVLSQAVTLSGNLITDSGRNGVYLRNEARAAGAFVSQSLVVDLNTMAGNGSNGIKVHSQAYAATVSQHATLTSNFVSNNAHSGISFAALAVLPALSPVHVYAAMNGNQVVANGRDGIQVYQSGNDGIQHFTLGTQDNISFNTGHGINLSNAGAGFIFFTTDSATITGNSLSPQLTTAGINITVP